MIGIDIIAIDRFEKIGEGDYIHWSKFFTKAEWEYVFSKAHSAQSLAGIYAAKEAIIKAIKKETMEHANRIEVAHAADGKPIVKIDKNDRPDIHISISHTRDIAVAVAVKYE
ncbi:MAG: 4'-phosphopantetheinyl transferase superfamily protein [Patescibacteria group bacterium]